MTAKDFLNKMPCIVDMNSFSGSDEEKLLETDEIIRVEFQKRDTYPCYKIFYLHRIYNDDRVYKCMLRLKKLPEWLRSWINERETKETPLHQYWDK